MASVDEINSWDLRGSELHWLSDRRPFLSQQEAADFFGVSVKTIYRMRKSGELRSVTSDSGRIYIPREALEVWCDSHYYGPLTSTEESSSLAPIAIRQKPSLFQKPVISLRDLDAELSALKESA